MVPLRHIVPAVLVAAAAAWGITYFIAPSEQTAADPPPLPVKPDASSLAVYPMESPDQRTREDEKAAADFLRAAQAILRQAPNTRASFKDSDGPPIAGPVPLPRRRPIPR
jgi:hypothetical protein